MQVEIEKLVNFKLKKNNFLIQNEKHRESKATCHRVPK